MPVLQKGRLVYMSQEAQSAVAALAVVDTIVVALAVVVAVIGFFAGDWLLPACAVALCAAVSAHAGLLIVSRGTILRVRLAAVLFGAMGAANGLMSAMIVVLVRAMTQ